MVAKKKGSGKAYKKKNSTMKSLIKPTANQILQRASEFPIIQCRVLDGWKEQGMAHVLIVRQQPDGRIAFADFLVDLLCLGVKDCMIDTNITNAEFKSRFWDKLQEIGAFVDCSVELAHAIVFGAVDYARSLGFPPHDDFKRGQFLLNPRESFDTLPDVEFGVNGKPQYIAGPYDDVNSILETLRKNVGEGNFDYIYQPDFPF